MSGGAWDCKYPQFAEEDEIMQHIDNLRLMAHYCRDHNKTTAAHELKGFINHLVEAKRKISLKFKRVKELIHHIDYVAAGDSGWEVVDRSVKEIQEGDAIQEQGDGGSMSEINRRINELARKLYPLWMEYGNYCFKEALYLIENNNYKHDANRVEEKE